ncbi:MAG: exopolysaccharide export protein EpsY [Cystobacter sp.]
MKTVPPPMSPSRPSPPLLALLAALAFAAGCYHPGRFIWVDEYRENQQTQDDSYIIRKGDLLDVNVWNQDRITTRLRVRDDGRISLPLINDVDAAGLTPAALARAVEQKLKELVANPVVTVMVMEAQPIRVSVLGEVRNAGQKRLESGAGLLQAISDAGGFTDYAREDGLYVLRREPGYPNPLRIRFDWRALSRNEGNAATFVLKTGDVVVVE